MTDRVPTYPGRVKMTKEDGSVEYVTMERADEPTQVGTPLNKNTFLTDSTAEALGLGAVADPTVDQAFLAILLQSKEGCLIYLDVTVKGSPAKAGIPITGVTTVGGGSVVTTGQQTILCFSATAETTLSTPAYLDMPSSSKSFPTPQGQIVRETLELTPPTAGEMVFSSSQDVLFSPYATEMDICCVGGGGGGGASSYPSGICGGGGGGGYVTNQLAITIRSGVVYRLTVGQGGAGGKNYINNNGVYQGGNGSDGGTSSVAAADGSLSIQASGGKKGGGGQYNYVSETGTFGSGGAGNGAGGKGNQKGTNGTVRRFGKADGVLYSGGGGGGSFYSYSTPLSGGSPNGGAGGCENSGTTPAQKAGKNASGVGGGGGGGGGITIVTNAYQVSPGGSGYRGEIAIRWHIEEDAA